MASDPQKPLDPVEVWMVKCNLEYVQAEGAGAVVARLRGHGYYRVAAAVEQQAARKEGDDEV